MMLKRNFSLLELLAVMAIMAALITVMLPGFNKMVKGNKVDQMASQIKLVLEQGQSEAITRRKNVAVIFPNGNSSHWPILEHRLGGARLAVVEKNKDSNTSWNFVNWIKDREWKLRIPGAALIRVVGKESDSAVYGNRKKLLEWFDNGVPDAVSGPAGALGTANVLLNINQNTATDFPYSDTVGDRDNCAVIFNKYGELVNQSMYLVIAESDIDNSNLVYPVRAAGAAATASPTNFVVLDINQFSGKVEFVNLVD